MKTIRFIFTTSILILFCSNVFAQLEWVPFEGEIPTNAVIGGHEANRILPVCRCEFMGAKHPGKVVANKCNIGYGGAEKAVAKFEILVNNGMATLDWFKAEGKLPDNAVQAGTERGVPLYVGRSLFKGGTHPGKVFSIGKGRYICNIGYGGKEITEKTFEVLVEIHPKKEAMHLDHDNRCDIGIDSIGGEVAVATYIGSMPIDRRINEGTCLVSNNMRYAARVTDDGRFVVEEVLEHAFCEDGRLLVFHAKEMWASQAKGQAPNLNYYLILQKEDGNLCVYSEEKGFVWCAMCHNKNGHHLELTNDGHIEVVNKLGSEIWPD